MFRCAACKLQSKPGDAQHKVVTDWRVKTYENTIRKGKKIVTIKSEGKEILREVAMCSPCAARTVA